MWEPWSVSTALLNTTTYGTHYFHWTWLKQLHTIQFDPGQSAYLEPLALQKWVCRKNVWSCLHVVWGICLPHFAKYPRLKYVLILVSTTLVFTPYKVPFPKAWFILSWTEPSSCVSRRRPTLKALMLCLPYKGSTIRLPRTYVTKGSGYFWLDCRWVGVCFFHSSQNLGMVSKRSYYWWKRYSWWKKSGLI